MVKVVVGFTRLVVDTEDEITPAVIGKRRNMSRELRSVLWICRVHPSLELDTEIFVGPGNEVGQI